MKFPVTIIDNFFEYPDQIVDFANSVEYFDTEGRYPGKRSKLLGDIAPKIQDEVIRNVFSNFMMLTNNFNLIIDSTFQKVSPDYGEGWTHRDECIMTIIVYLNKGASLGRGTSILRPTSVVIDSQEKWKRDTRVKHEGLKSKNFTEEYIKSKQEANSKFEETMRIENVYNRCLLFNGNEYHRANDFINNDNDEERLTLVSFVKSIYAHSMETPEGRRMNKL